MPLSKVGREPRWWNDVWVETGTAEGDSVALLLGFGVKRALSVETDHARYTRACARFLHDDRVSLFFGDSGAFVESAAALLAMPITWWLDAHEDFPGRRTPLLRELRAILNRGRKDVVLIDDMPKIGGSETRYIDDGDGHEIVPNELVALIQRSRPGSSCEWVSSSAAHGRSDYILAASLV